MEQKNLKQFTVRRKEIEGELNDLLKEHKSPYSLENIKEIIYNEEESDEQSSIKYFHILIKMV